MVLKGLFFGSALATAIFLMYLCGGARDDVDVVIGDVLSQPSARQSAAKRELGIVLESSEFSAIDNEGVDRSVLNKPKRWALILDLSFPPGTDPSKAEISVTIRDSAQEPLSVTQLRWDDNELLSERDIDLGVWAEGEVHDVQIEVRHEQCVPQEGVVRADSAAARNDKMLIVHRVILLPAFEITGRLLDGNGSGVPGVPVFLFEEKDESPPHSMGPPATSDHEGRFCISISRSGSWRLIADGGFAGAATAVVDTAFRSQNVPDMVMQRPCSIAGRVLMFGEPLCDAHLIVENPVSSPPFFTDIGSFVVNGNQLEMHRKTAVSLAQGQFAVSGLLPGAYDVIVSRLPGLSVHPLVGHGLPIRVMAPADNVVVSVAGALLDVRVRSDHRVFAGVVVVCTVDFQGSSFAVTEEDGECEIFVKPGYQYRISASLEGFISQEVEVFVGREGSRVTVDLNLVEKKSDAVLRFRVREGDSAPPVGFFSFAFSPMSVAPCARPLFVVSRWSENGTYEFGGIPVGNWRVDVQPGGSEGTASFHCEKRLDLSVPHDGVMETDVEIVRGGMLRMTVRGAGGEALRAKCRLLFGEKLAPICFGIFRSGQGFSESQWVDGEAELARPLFPGDYVIEVECAGHSVTRWPVKIAAGQVTKADLLVRKEN